MLKVLLTGFFRVRDCSGSFWRGEHRAKTFSGKPDPFWVTPKD